MVLLMAIEAKDVALVGLDYVTGLITCWKPEDRARFSTKYRSVTLRNTLPNLGILVFQCKLVQASFAFDNLGRLRT